MKDNYREPGLDSLREWLNAWGPEGAANWSDPTGFSIPITKATLTKLLDDRDRLLGLVRAHEATLSQSKREVLFMVQDCLQAFASDLEEEDRSEEAYAIYQAIEFLNTLFPPDGA